MVTAVTGAGELDLWLRSFGTANWDLAVIYCGPEEFECPQCIHVERGQGTKWQAVFQFLRSSAFKRGYARHYKQVRWWASLLHWQAALLGCSGGLVGCCKMPLAAEGVLYALAMPLAQCCLGNRRCALTERQPWVAACLSPHMTEPE